ncbi:MAG: hypothetical protein IJ794_00080 [Lachnospiraceae bacterium]|nr:hypothetical protein [Lachnospiraceae bacterium]
MNKRKLSLEKYGISGKRYKELCGFCEQYPDWINELKYHHDTVAGREITGMPIPPHNNSDQTGNLAVRRMELQKKCELIEQTAIQASADMYQYIIKSVCYEVPVTYLISCENMPLGKSAFYELRRYFFYLLDKNKTF